MSNAPDDLPPNVERTLRALGRSFDDDEWKLVRHLNSTQSLRKFDKVQGPTLLADSPFENGLRELAKAAFLHEPFMPGIPGLAAARRHFPLVKSDKFRIPSTATSRFHAFDADDFDGWMQAAADNYAIGDGIPENFLGDYVALGDGPARQLGDDADLWRKLHGDKTMSEIAKLDEAFPTSLLFDGVRIRERRGRLHLLAICRVVEPLTLMEAITVHAELGALPQAEDESEDSAENPDTSSSQSAQDEIRETRAAALLSDAPAGMTLRFAVCLEIDPQSDDLWKNVSALSWFRNDPIGSIVGASKSEDAMLGYTDEERSLVNWLLHTTDLVMPTILMALLLPSYFDFRAEDRLDYRSRGGLRISDGEPHEGSEPSSSKKRGGRVRVVSSIKHSRYASPGRRASGSRAEPEEQVEVTGFWRRLSPTSIGRDKDGNPITGRTWVNSHVRWKDKPAPRRRILQKEPILPHLRRITDRFK